MTVSIGNGVDLGNLVTAATNPLTGMVDIQIQGASSGILQQTIYANYIPFALTGTTVETLI